MKVYSDISLRDFEPWSGAKPWFEEMVEKDLTDEIESLIDELYPDGLEDGKLNDLLWFDEVIHSIIKNGGYYDEEDEDEEEEEE